MLIATTDGNENIILGMKSTYALAYTISCCALSQMKDMYCLEQSKQIGHSRPPFS